MTRAPKEPSSSERWVVLGAGYGGLAFASRWAYHQKELARRLTRVPALYVINSSAHSDCTCELYRALRHGEPEVFDVPKLFAAKQITFKEARVFEIDPRAKVLKLRTEIREDFTYDRLFIATGASRFQTQLPGIDALIAQQNPIEPRVFHARSNRQISELRMALSRIHWFSKPKAAGHIAPKASFVVVVGGGATGIEIAGELAAMRGRDSLKRVIVVEEHYDPLKPILGRVAYKLLREQMKSMRIEYFEGSGATRVDGKHLFLENGQLIPWDLLVMAQGTGPDKALFAEFGDVWANQQRVRVGRDFQIEDWNKHYALGDLANYEWGGQTLPKTAQVASQQGVYLADRLAAELLGENVKPPVFRWQNWGYLVSLGAMNGAGKLGSWPLPVLWGPAVDIAKRGARMRFDAQVATGLRLSP